MNIKSVYLALTSLWLASGKTMAMYNSTTTEVFQQDLLIEPYPSRSLQTKKKKRKNEDCNIWGEVSCTVTATGETCKEVSIPADDTCKPVPIEMNYTICNRETLPENKIILLTSLTYYDLYKDGKVFPKIPGIKANECLHIIQEGTIDCFRKRVNAEMMFEGWKGFRKNYGNYCHFFQHYFPKLIKFTQPPTSAPTRGELPAYKVITLCYLEEVKGSGKFTVPCEELGIEYFKNSYVKARNFVLLEDQIDYEREVKYEFIIESNVEETVTVDEISVFWDGEEVKVVTAGDNIKVGPGEKKSVAESKKEIDFAAYSGSKYEIESVVKATGDITGSVFLETNVVATDVP